ncbi:hypothetical protein [Simkania sp.]|uniref:hypothetical protein n=1 Tax=Simkania sp. TaxID=34094 RepID=UPI003B527690
MSSSSIGGSSLPASTQTREMSRLDRKFDGFAADVTTREEVIYQLVLHLLEQNKPKWNSNSLEFYGSIAQDIVGLSNRLSSLIIFGSTSPAPAQTHERFSSVQQFDNLEVHDKVIYQFVEHLLKQNKPQWNPKSLEFLKSIAPVIAGLNERLSLLISEIPIQSPDPSPLKGKEPETPITHDDSTNVPLPIGMSRAYSVGVIDPDSA